MNHLKVLPLGQLASVPVDIERLYTYVDIEVIEIVYNINLYPALPGIYWEMENETIMDLKMRWLSFEDS